VLQLFTRTNRRVKFYKFSLGFFMSQSMYKTPALQILLTCSLLLFSCKDKQGTVDAPQTVPRLLSASIDPPWVHLDSNRTIVDSLGNNIYRITISAAATAIDADGAGDIGSLSLVVRTPRLNSPLFAGLYGPDARITDTAWFAVSASFMMERCDAAFTVDFQAQDNSQLTSNALGLSFTAYRNNLPPSLSNLIAPDTVVRPSTGSVTFLFAATTIDPDGLCDVADVSFYLLSPPPPSGAIPLFDDGDPAKGDQTAGDGIFSRIVSISSQNTLGEKRIVFLAKDRAGALSDSLFHSFYVVE
jgi:hypothetical protein